MAALVADGSAVVGLTVVVLAEVAEIVLTHFSLSPETSIYSCVQNHKSSHFLKLRVQAEACYKFHINLC